MPKHNWWWLWYLNKQCNGVRKIHNCPLNITCQRLECLLEHKTISLSCLKFYKIKAMLTLKSVPGLWYCNNIAKDTKAENIIINSQETVSISKQRYNIKLQKRNSYIIDSSSISINLIALHCGQWTTVPLAIRIWRARYPCF